MLRERLKELRKTLGITQVEISRVARLHSTTAYGSWERGRTNPDIESLCKLADFFNVSIDHLLGRADFQSGTDVQPFISERNNFGLEWIVRKQSINDNEKNILDIFLLACNEESIAEIAHRKEMTRSEVKALIRKALDNDFVQFLTLEYNSDLETSLERNFNLRRAVVPVTGGTDDFFKLLIIAEAAAKEFSRLVKAGEKVGISSSYTLSRVVMALRNYECRGIELFPLDADPVTEDIHFSANALISMLKLFHTESNIKSHLIPNIMGDTDKFSQRSTDITIKHTLLDATNVDIAFVGIGALDAEIPQSTLVSTLATLECNLNAIINETHAVGDIAFNLIKQDGTVAKNDFVDRIPHIKAEELQKMVRQGIPIIGVASGLRKANACYAVLRGKFISEIIVDDILAQAILEISESDPTVKKSR